MLMTLGENGKDQLNGANVEPSLRICRQCKALLGTNIYLIISPSHNLFFRTPGTNDGIANGEFSFCGCLPKTLLPAQSYRQFGALLSKHDRITQVYFTPFILLSPHLNNLAMVKHYTLWKRPMN
jgi:hypothetical protein